MNKFDKYILLFYAIWAALSIIVSFMHEGLGVNNITRLMVIAVLFVNLGWYWCTRSRATSQSGAAFILKCSLSAMAVEFCYMFSRPVFDSLLVVQGMSVAQLVRNTAIDFAFTFPAYIVFFSLFWFLINRYHYRISEYVIVFSFAQALGDGNAFFLANPGMLILAPYVMLNYQAMNIVPYLRVRDSLAATRQSRFLKYILPLVLLPVLYWLAGALILMVGRWYGFVPPPAA